MDNARWYLFGAFIIYFPFAETLSYRLSADIWLAARLFVDILYAAILLATLLYSFRNRSPFILPQSLKIPLGIVLLFAVITLAGANLPQALSTEGEQPLLMGLWGLKVLLGYVFVIPCVYYLLRNREDLMHLLRLQVAIALICCCLGIVQYAFFRVGICEVNPPEGALFSASLSTTCFVWGSFLHMPEQGLIRLPGPFASPFQWEWFLISSVFFGFGAALCDLNRYWRWAAWVGVALAWVNAFISGSRLAFWIVPLLIVILLIGTGQITSWRRFSFFAAGLAATFVLFGIKHSGVNQMYPNIIDYWRLELPGSFLFHQLSWALDHTNILLGQGLGRATNSARIFGSTNLIEAYSAKLLFELGIPGFIAMFGLYTTLVVTLFQSYRLISSSPLRKCALVFWIFVLFISYFPYYYALDVAPVNVYYWLAAGIVLKLPELANS